MLIGKQVSVCRVERQDETATVCDIDERCRLVVEYEDGKIENLDGGEVRINGKISKRNCKIKQKAVSRTLRLVRIAIFVALIIVGAFVKFPIGIVPVSMQFAFCMFASLMLGGLDSFICVAIYIVMGLIGIPVFSAGGGFAYVLQPTFGYILGF